MKEKYCNIIIALIFVLSQFLLAKKIKQVPLAKDLSNHFGSEPKNNYYGPHHFINKDTFLHNNDNFLSRFNLENNFYIASGKISQISKEAENIISPLVPVK